MIDQFKSMPLAVFVPLWIAWAIAGWLLLRHWLAPLLLLPASIAASLYFWPWLQHDAAVLPPALWIALLAVTPILSSWLVARQRQAGASRWAAVVPLVAGAVLLSATGVVHVVGQAEAEKPTPARSKIIAGDLSADGRHLVLKPVGTHPTLGGKQGGRMSSWIVETDTGALLRDGYLQREYSHFDFIRPGLFHVNLKTSGKGVWSLDIDTGKELMLALRRSDLINEHLWHARASSDGFVDIYLPGEDEPTQVPWSGPMKYGPEPGILYGHEDGALVRFDALRGTRTILAPLPEDLPDKSWSIAISPLGDALTLSTPKHATRILNSSDGTVLYELPERWWSAWTGGPSPLAIVRPPRRDEQGVRLPFRPESQWIDASGVRPVKLPSEGMIISSASGRVFLLGDSVAELSPEGSVLRTLEIKPIEGGAAR